MPNSLRDSMKTSTPNKGTRPCTGKSCLGNGNAEEMHVHPGQMETVESGRINIADLPKVTLKMLIRGYQLVLSPWIGRQCRFYPTCSHYAMGAIEEYGAAKGSFLAIKRIGKCHPYHPGGVDLVPEKDSLSSR